MWGRVQVPRQGGLIPPRPFPGGGTTRGCGEQRQGARDLGSAGAGGPSPNRGQGPLGKRGWGAQCSPRGPAWVGFSRCRAQGGAGEEAGLAQSSFISGVLGSFYSGSG